MMYFPPFVVGTHSSLSSGSCCREMVAEEGEEKEEKEEDKKLEMKM